MGRIEGRFDAIAVFGGANVDRIATTRSAAVAGASNPGTVRTGLGGVGFNVALDLARLGHAVRLVTRVGAEADGAALAAAARVAGIDTAGVTISPGSPTATYHAAFDHAGSLVIGIADMAAVEEMTPAVLAAAAAVPARREMWIVDANLLAESLVFLAGRAAASGAAVAALAVSPSKAMRLVPALGQIDLLFANRLEAAAVLGVNADAPAVELATALAARHGLAAVVSDGAEPVVVASGGEVRALATLAARVRNVNGAGDALAAGTVHGLALDQPLFDAVLSGLAAAAITVEEDAAAAPGLSRAALAARLALSPKDPA